MSLTNCAKKKKAKSSQKLSREKRCEQKLKKEKNSLCIFSKKCNSWISEEAINQIALLSGYIKRTDLKILPLPFLLTLAYTMFGCGNATLVMLASSMSEWFNIQINPQAISERLHKKETVSFLKNIFIAALTHQIKHGLNNAYAKIFSQFTAVHLEDSTQFRLHEETKGKFKGCGGSASSAAMKLNVAYNITQHTVTHVDIASGATPDQGLSKNFRRWLKKGALLIRDLGYFNILDMIMIDKIKAFFLSRLKKGVNIYLNENDTKSMDIYKFLEENTKNNNSFDKDVYVGNINNRLKVRIVGEKVPGHVQQQRIKSYNENKVKRDKKKKMKKDYFEWFGYSIFITNIGRDIFSFAEIIMAVYKIRWQIELFFKRIKSILQIHIIKVKSPNRTLCLIYAKLISLLMSQSIMSYTASICDQELSEHKLIQWLKQDNRLAHAIISNDLHSLFVKLLNALYLLEKNKRKKRKTTLQHIQDAYSKDMEEQAEADRVAI